MIEKVILTNGKTVPQVCIDALEEFDKIWPRATTPQARAGIASAVIEAFKKSSSDDS